MLLEKAWHLLRKEVFPVPSSDRLFNPYHDRSDGLDLPHAVEIRRENLHRYLSCYAVRPPVFFLAEAPGPWGCRFSGVPLVSEAQLVDAAFPVSGQPSSTREAPHNEYSAGIYWRVLGPYFPRFFTWNSVPYHPHKPGQPLSIRNPTNREVAAFTGLLSDLLRAVQPEHLVAVGRRAEYALQQIGAACTYVRHPSQGGARLFEAGVQALFREIGI